MSVFLIEHDAWCADGCVVAIVGRVDVKAGVVPSWPRLDVLPEMRIIVSAMAGHMKGPEGALARAAGVHRYCPPEVAALVS